MKIIDAHFHIADCIAGYCRRGELRAIGAGKARWANGETFQLFPADYGDRSFSAESALRILDENKIEKAVLMQGSMYGFQNHCTMEAVKSHPHRFAGACTVDPFMTDWREVLLHLLDDCGFSIVKFEVSSGGGLMGCHDPFPLDGVKMIPIYEEIAKRNATLVLDIGNLHMASYQPQAVANIAKQYPEMKLVVCHLLAPQHGHLDSLKQDVSLLALPNVYFDLAALPIIVEEQFPYPAAIQAIATAKEIVGASQILWGTDAPFALTRDTYSQLVKYITESDLFTQAELADVFYHNAQRVYFSKETNKGEQDG